MLRLNLAVVISLLGFVSASDFVPRGNYFNRYGFNKVRTDYTSPVFCMQESSLECIVNKITWLERIEQVHGPHLEYPHIVRMSSCILSMFLFALCFFINDYLQNCFDSFWLRQKGEERCMVCILLSVYGGSSVIRLFSKLPFFQIMVSCFGPIAYKQHLADIVTAQAQCMGEKFSMEELPHASNPNAGRTVSNCQFFS